MWLLTATTVPPSIPLAALDTTLQVLVVCLLLALGVVLILLALRVLAALERVEGRLASLDRLEGIAGHLERSASQKGPSDSSEARDLRRLEHVLVDLRDGQRRLAERLLALVEEQRVTREELETGTGPAERSGGTPVAERVATRLVAMGYEQIEILTPPDELASMQQDGGEVQVEARRAGALHKGRVRVAGGAIADVQLRSSYEAYP